MCNERGGNMVHIVGVYFDIGGCYFCKYSERLCADSPGFIEANCDNRVVFLPPGRQVKL